MNKVRTVMKEFKSGSLKSSSGKKVTNPKQAIAIALSEARRSKSNLTGGGMPLKPMYESTTRSRESDEAKRSAISKEEYPSLKMPKTPTPASMKKGGMAESKKMMAKEVSFMKKKGAPKSMIKHEMSEMGMKKGGMAKYAKGGAIASKMGTVRTAAPSRDGVATKGKTKGTMVKMMNGGMTKKMKSGGKC